MRRRTKVFAYNKLKAVQNGNLVDSNTWVRCISSNLAFGGDPATAATTYTSDNFTIAGESLAGIMIQYYLANTINSTGILTGYIRDVTTNTILSGSSVSIKISDIPAIGYNASNNTTWGAAYALPLKFLNPITPGQYIPGNTFRVEFNQTTASINPRFSSLIGNALGAAIFTTSNQQPLTGDNFYINSDYLPLNVKIFNNESIKWAKDLLVGAWAPGITGPTGADLFDLSGYNQKGLLVNLDASIAWASTERGLAINISSDNARITHSPITLLGNEGYTINTWAKLTAAGFGVNTSCYMYGNSSTNNQHVRILGFPMSTVRLATTGGNFDFFSDTRDLSDWFMLTIVVTNEGSLRRASWYHNGLLVNSITSSSANVDLTLNEFGDGAAGYSSFPGYIADHKIYKKPLNAIEVLRLYNNELGYGLKKSSYRRGYSYSPTQYPRIHYNVIMNNTDNTLLFGVPVVNGTSGVGTTQATAHTGMQLLNGSTLSYANNPGNNYIFRMRGNILIGPESSFIMGSVDSPIDRTSTATLEIDSDTLNQWGLTVSNRHRVGIHGGKFIAQGQSRTAGKDADKCLLSSNASAGATSLTIDTDTGWLAGDQIGIGATAINSTHSNNEQRTLASNATSNSLAITSGLTASKDGDASIVQSPIVLLSRNVSIKSASIVNLNPGLLFSGQWRLNLYGNDPYTEINVDWASFDNVAITLNGIGSKDKGAYNKCILTASTFYYDNNHSFCAFDIQNCNSYGTAIFFRGGTQNPDQISGSTINNCYILGASSYALGLYFNKLAYIDNIRICASATGLDFNAGNPFPPIESLYISNIFIHSGGTGILYVRQADIKNPTIINNLNIFRMNNYGIHLRGSSLLVDNFKLWNCRLAGVYLDSNGYTSKYTVLKNGFIANQSGGSMEAGIRSNILHNPELILENVKFGIGFTGAINHTTSDILFNANPGSNPSSAKIKLRNCYLNNNTRIGNSLSSDLGYILSENDQQIPGAKYNIYKYGIISSDTVIFGSSSPSIRLKPNTANIKLKYTLSRFAVVKNTTPTITVKIRKSASGDGASYNGNQPRLLLLDNPVIGVDSTTVLATCVSSNGTWETLSATLPTIQNNGIATVVIDCDGTTGWINVDDITLPISSTLDLVGGDGLSQFCAYGTNYGGGTINGGLIID